MTMSTSSLIIWALSKLIPIAQRFKTDEYSGSLIGYLLYWPQQEPKNNLLSGSFTCALTQAVPINASYNCIYAA